MWHPAATCRRFRYRRTTPRPEQPHGAPPAAAPQCGRPVRAKAASKLGRPGPRRVPSVRVWITRGMPMMFRLPSCWQVFHPGHTGVAFLCASALDHPAFCPGRGRCASRSHCFVVSSMHTTGCDGSWGACTPPASVSSCTRTGVLLRRNAPHPPLPGYGSVFNKPCALSPGR